MWEGKKPFKIEPTFYKCVLWKYIDVFLIKTEIFRSKVHTKNQVLIYSFILPVLFLPFRLLPILGFLSPVVSVAVLSLLVHRP